MRHISQRIVDNLFPYNIVWRARVFNNTEILFKINIWHVWTKKKWFCIGRPLWNTEQMDVSKKNRITSRYVYLKLFSHYTDFKHRSHMWFVIKRNPIIAFLFLLRWPSLCWKWLFGWYRNIINHTIAGSEKVSPPFCALWFLFRYATCFWIVRWFEDFVMIRAMREQWFRFEIVSCVFFRKDAEFLIPILFCFKDHFSWKLENINCSISQCKRILSRGQRMNYPEIMQR